MHCWQTGGQHSLIDTFSPSLLRHVGSLLIQPPIATWKPFLPVFASTHRSSCTESRVPARYIRPLATAPPRELIPTPLTTTSQAPPPADLETGGEL